MNIRDRIQLALKGADKSRRDLAKFMGLSAPTVNTMLTKKVEIDSIKYLKAVEDLTGYRFEWLRTGIGPEKKEDSDNENESSIAYWKDRLKNKNELIEELRGRIEDMKKYTELLERQLKEKKRD